MKAALRLAGFGLAFERRALLRDLAFDVPAHGCTVLLGPSGTGKSTLLRTLAGLTADHPLLRVSGQAIYCDAVCEGNHRPALVEQKAQLLMSTVRENLVSGLSQRSRLTPALQIEEIRPLLMRLGQGELLDELSRQVIDLPLQKQRIVAILRQVISLPALLMVDEPTANLSREAAEPVLALLKALSKEMAVLVVSHHLEQTRRLADHVILIASGRTHESTSAQQFFHAPQSEAARQFLRTGSCPETGLGTCEDLIANRADAAATHAAPDATKAELSAPSDEQNAIDLASRIFLDSAAAASSCLPTRSAACGPRGFVWLIEGKVGGTPLPGILHDTQDDLRLLRDVGVTRLISLTETPFNPSLADASGIRVASCPILDMHAPTLTQAVRLCEDIDRFLTMGECVAVHCRAGLGRTGTALGAYWLWYQRGQIEGAAALAHVRRLQSGMVQSADQEAFLMRFAVLVREAFAHVQSVADMPQHVV